MDLVKAGQMTLAEARQSPLKNELSQAIGSPLGVIPDYNYTALKMETAAQAALEPRVFWISRLQSQMREV